MKGKILIQKAMLAIMAGSLMSAPTFAAQTTATPKATATLAKSCTISATGIDFGNVTGSSHTQWAPSAGNIGVLCSNQTAYTIALNMGLDNISHSRNMVGTNSGQTITYTVCQTQSFSGTFGSGGSCGKTWRTDTDVSVTYAGTGNGFLQNIPTYGIINSGYYTPDTYSDTITATITY